MYEKLFQKESPNQDFGVSSSLQQLQFKKESSSEEKTDKYGRGIDSPRLSQDIFKFFDEG